MNALILAGGKGERLRKVTDSIPKPMLIYKRKPLLEHNINLCKKFGIKNIFINTHHLPHIIKNYFGNGENFDVSITYSFEEELLGTASTVKNFETFLRQDPFFVIYGDNYSNYNLNLLKEKAESENALVVIGFHYRADIETSGVAEFDNNDKILRFIEKPKSNETESHWVNSGIYYLHPEIFQALPDRYADFGQDIFPMLIRHGIPIFGICQDSDVKAFDTLEMAKNNCKKINVSEE